ncbi:MAG: SCO family protein [Myxococcota bacterium]|nr:SCO family protein [Myxococcota bacterium]
MSGRACPAALAWLCAVGLLAGCSQGHDSRGVVREVRPEWNQVVIAHEDIPGLMPAMTMNFDVEDPELLATLEKGQAISFTVQFTGRAYVVTRAEVLGQAGEGGGAGLAGLLPERQPAPDFRLTDQAGGEVSLDSLRGTTLLLDFVYTACPGPCPVQTARHVELQRSLSAEVRERTRFVSISLDPERDTPEALRAYAEARGADLGHWSFLTGPSDAVARVVKSFGVGSLRKPDGEIEHLMATFLIDGDGRIAERYVGLDQDTATMRRDLERISAASAREPEA